MDFHLRIEFFCLLFDYKFLIENKVGKSRIDESVFENWGQVN